MNPRFSSKILFCILAASLLSAAVSCGGDSDVDSPALSDTTAVTMTTSEPTSEQQRYIDALPDADYTGEIFSILTRPDEETYGTISFWAESEIGDTLNDFVFQRNRKVEERYHITIEQHQDAELEDIIQAMAFSNEDAYDMISDWVKSVNSHAAQGYYYNLYDIPTINLQNPWWDSECLELMTISGRLFTAFSDMNVQPMDLLSGICVNNELVTKLDLRSPYEAVLDGTWTMDLFYEMCVDATSDANGDSVMDEQDQWGYITGVGDINAWINAGGQSLIAYDSNGNMRLNYGSQDAIAVLEKMDRIINNTAISVYLNDNAWGESVFLDGRALFSGARVSMFYHDYRDLNIDIGMVPFPKYDEAQTEYCQMMSNCSMGISVPVNASDPERTGVIIEALGAYSYIEMHEVYYETTLQDKLSRDEYSKSMLDIIVNSRVIDIAVFNEDAWDKIITSFHDAFHESGTAEIASLVAKNETSFQNKLEKIYESYENLE